MSGPHLPRTAEDAVFAEDSDFQELTKRFLESLARKRFGLALALREERWGDLSQIAHQLKGTAGGYGFPKVSQAAQALESACRHEPSAVSSRLGDLLAVIDQILPE